MEYSVGSLADLISGSNTPNKPKVVKKEFRASVDHVSPQNKKSPKKKERLRSPKKELNNTVEDVSDVKSEFIKKSPKKIKKVKRVKKGKEIVVKQEEESDFKNEPNENGFTIDVKKPKKGKKRKLEKPTGEPDAVDDDASPPKKEKLSKNEKNAERRVKKKNRDENRIQEDPEELARTIYVGNVPISIDKKKVKQHFRKYGKIKTIRIRGIPVANPKVLKKVAAIKKEFNPNRSNVYCYIKFETKESAHEAEAENGKLFEEHHLRVHCCESQDKPDETKAIFVGNLSFNAEEDELWSLFESCGPISYVRIVRDHHTGMGKGFAYVNFMDSDAVQLALEMENVKLKDRELRISLCNHSGAQKNKKLKKAKKITKPRKPKSRKNDGSKTGEQVSEVKHVWKKESKSEFQGTKFSDKKKKHKLNKGLLEKKKIMKKIAPKPK